MTNEARPSLFLTALPLLCFIVNASERRPRNEGISHAGGSAASSIFVYRPIGRGGVDGNPPFGLQQIYTPPSLAVYAAAMIVSQAPFCGSGSSSQDYCDERTRVNTCVKKLLFQALESSPVVLLVSHCQQ